MRNFLLAVRRFQVRAVLFVLYYAVFTPYAAATKLFGVRFLETERDGRESYWVPRPPRDAAASSRKLY